jgi:hypothetical protein
MKKPVEVMLAARQSGIHKRAGRRYTARRSLKNMIAPLRYVARLTTGRIILWCYAIWYGVNVINHFEARPRLWLTSIGLSAIIGTALLIGMRASSRGTTELDGWQIFRLYLMPFCVSSFSALVKDAGYVLVFPPRWKENVIGFALIVLFVALVFGIKATLGKSDGAIEQRR